MSLQHEESDVNIRAIFGFGAGLIAVTLVVYLVVWLLFGYFDRREAATDPGGPLLAVGHETRLPPEPRLQVAPREDLRELQTDQQALLDGYRWVDKAAGIVRIPIGEAMKLTVQRGLPTRAAPEVQPK
jgi:hypothetical protein